MKTMKAWIVGVVVGGSTVLAMACGPELESSVDGRVESPGVLFQAGATPPEEIPFDGGLQVIPLDGGLDGGGNNGSPPDVGPVPCHGGGDVKGQEDGGGYSGIPGRDGDGCRP
ncbi:hypothetical protein [Vitiosangium sp. GDMCC 1.1324]|uniref:hypothetical protein n=1 Tax=Vitiosangium sp. (strain GDMCC 1.1324) TaxID=2138576 RepID=UPI000D34B6F3|nr:hypothetical protein [Vitiosangium sp. GDMCC 1.1324]PTL77235.1 hypothetical protein DAT35_45180 [Vitiosangium sp. GDMCC 1.1324]